MRRTVPVYLDAGEHPEARQQVGTCEVDPFQPGLDLTGTIQLDPEHSWLAGVVGGENIQVSFGFGPKGGCVVLREPE